MHQQKPLVRRLAVAYICLNETTEAVGILNVITENINSFTHQSVLIALTVSIIALLLTILT